MREIKFRAWDKKNQVWLDPNNRYQKFIDFNGGTYQYYAENDGSREMESLEHIILMQFTGLHDKNGKEIWEGDIVSFVQFGGGLIRAVIRWNDLRGMFDAEEGKIYLGYGMECEVLGNIYENQDLIGGQHV